MKVLLGGYEVEYKIVERELNQDEMLDELFSHSGVSTVLWVKHVLVKEKDASLKQAMDELAVAHSKYPIVFVTGNATKSEDTAQKITARYSELMRMEVFNFLNLSFAIGLDGHDILVYKNQQGNDLFVDVSVRFGCDMMHEAGFTDELFEYFYKQVGSDSKLLARWKEKAKHDDVQEINAFGGVE